MQKDANQKFTSSEEVSNKQQSNLETKIPENLMSGPIIDKSSTPDDNGRITHKLVVEIPARIRGRVSCSHADYMLVDKSPGLSLCSSTGTSKGHSGCLRSSPQQRSPFINNSNLNDSPLKFTPLKRKDSGKSQISDGPRLKLIQMGASSKVGLINNTTTFHPVRMMKPQKQAVRLVSGMYRPLVVDMKTGRDLGETALRRQTRGDVQTHKPLVQLNPNNMLVHGTNGCMMNNVTNFSWVQDSLVSKC